MKSFYFISKEQASKNEANISIELSAIAKDFDQVKELAEEKGIDLDNFVLYDSEKCSKTQLGKEFDPKIKFEY